MHTLYIVGHINNLSLPGYLDNNLPYTAIFGAAGALDILSTKFSTEILLRRGVPKEELYQHENGRAFKESLRLWHTENKKVKAALHTGLIEGFAFGMALLLPELALGYSAATLYIVPSNINIAVRKLKRKQN